jgi:hypothetical protein
LAKGVAAGILIYISQGPGEMQASVAVENDVTVMSFEILLCRM